MSLQKLLKLPHFILVSITVAGLFTTDSLKQSIGFLQKHIITCQ